MASAILFGGRRINVPGAYSRVDTSGLASQSPSEVGVVALIGVGHGGEPLTPLDFTRPGRALETFRGGPLRAATQFCFEPSQDEAIPGGAQRVVGVKVNPDTQAETLLSDEADNPTILLRSRDWGEDQNQISVDVSDGTNQGKLIEVSHQGEDEVFDDVGGDVLANLLNSSTTGTIPFEMRWLGGALSVGNTEARLGMVGFFNARASERTADIPDPGAVRVSSADAGDDAQILTVYGLDSEGAAVKDTLALDGTTEVTGTVTFSKVMGAVLSEETEGAVTVTDTDGSPTTLFSFTAGQVARGIRHAIDDRYLHTLGEPLILAGTNDAGKHSMVVGVDTTGQTVMEVIDPSAWETGLTTTTKWRHIKFYVAGDITQSAQGHFLKILPFSTYDTLGKLLDGISNVFEVEQDVAGPLHTPSVRLDRVNTDLESVDGQLNADEVNMSFESPGIDLTADTWAVVQRLQQSSSFVTAEFADGGSRRAPANTSSAVFLGGGEDGVPTIDDWRKAFDVLKKRRINVFVPLTRDAAVHHMLSAHLRLRASQLRSEANGYVGIGTEDGRGETRANIKSQVLALNTRHLSAVSQEVSRFDVDTGEATWFPPHILAAIAAGMQAGSPVAEPLTKKLISALDIRNDSSWNPEDDIEEMIDAGVMVAESEDGVGIRWVRSVTTHLQDDNPVLTEMSANESMNMAIFELRRRLEAKIGRRGLGGSVARIQGLAADELSRLVTDEIIVDWRALQVEMVGDVFPVSVEIAPVLPINFIPITVHVVALRAAA
jgi:hypothetical protein